MSAPILFLLKGYPRLSETFIAQEIRSLEKAGLEIRIASMRRPTDDRIHPVHREIKAKVGYLPEYLHEEPFRVLRGCATVLLRRGFFRAASCFVRDIRRDPSRNRLRRFGQGIVLAAELPRDITRIHAHFIHTPASVARYASMISGVAWSCSAHAKDIWTTPDWDLAEKLAASDWTVTCTSAGRDRLATLSKPGKPVRLVYHGLDLNRFPLIARRLKRRDGADPNDPVQLLTVARAVEKKGLDDLLNALARLPAPLSWRWTHVGGGALVSNLRELAAELGIADRCAFLGALDQGAVLERYRGADLFVLPCRVASDGDRDGLPNVLAEAASQGVAILSTTIAGIPELVEDDVDGMLTPPGDLDALSQALAQLITQPDLRRRYGDSAGRKVRRAFDHDRSMSELVRLFDGDVARTARGSVTEELKPAE